MWPRTTHPRRKPGRFGRLCGVPIFTLLYLLVSNACLPGRLLFRGWRPLPWCSAGLPHASRADRQRNRLRRGFGLFPSAGWFSQRSCCTGLPSRRQFEIIKDSIGSLTADRRLQALLIAFAFGAFIEGAAGSVRGRRGGRHADAWASRRSTRGNLSARQHRAGAFGSIGTRS